MDLYKQNRMKDKFPADDINEFLQGYRRAIASEREEVKMPSQECKRALTFESYRSLVKYSLEAGYNAVQYVNNTNFILLCWYLMCRSISASKLMDNNITWIGDALVINKLPRHKGDQEGSHVYPKNVFANPLDPLICPVLHDIIYVMILM